MTARKFIFLISAFVNLALFSCNRYLDTVSNTKITPVQQGAISFYIDSNILLYKSNIALKMDQQTLYPKTFRVRLPKGIKWYRFSNSENFEFYYNAKQAVFIHIDLAGGANHQDSVTNGSENAVSEFLQHNAIHDNAKYNISKINFDIKRKHEFITKGSATILLYNIETRNYDRFVDDLKSFEFIN